MEKAKFIDLKRGSHKVGLSILCTCVLFAFYYWTKDMIEISITLAILYQIAGSIMYLGFGLDGTLDTMKKTSMFYLIHQFFKWMVKYLDRNF